MERAMIKVRNKAVNTAIIFLQAAFLMLSAAACGSDEMPHESQAVAPMHTAEASEEAGTPGETGVSGETEVPGQREFSQGTGDSGQRESSQGTGDSGQTDISRGTADSAEDGESPATEDSAAEEETANGSSYGDVACGSYEIGDIILADGSIVKGADMTAIGSANIPIAVVAGFGENGTAFCVGVHRSDEPLQWASDDSAGYAAGFAETVCTQISDFGFSGDRDGSDNWEAMCAQDKEDTADAAANYPAFHFAVTYGETHSLSGDYASGWYLPGIAELCGLYQNREMVNRSLQQIYSLDNLAAMNGLETNWYWSSSQAGAADDCAWFVHYFNGYAGECPKNFTNVHALAVHELASEAF